MYIKLKDDRVFKNTVDGVYVEVGGEPVKVDDKTGKYLLDNFPDKLELVSTKKKAQEEV